jgi:hypothetical protein
MGSDKFFLEWFIWFPVSEQPHQKKMIKKNNSIHIWKYKFMHTIIDYIKVGYIFLYLQL